MELLALYEAILKSLNFKITEEGLLTYCYEDMEIPATLDGKRLTLPTRDVMRSGNWDGRIAFHPLSENLLRGESPVIRKLKGVVNHRVSSLLTDLIMAFSILGHDNSRHKTLSPKAAEVLSAMPGIDEKFVDTVKKILHRQEEQGANRLISVYLKRGGTFQGRKVARVAVVSFPILEQIAREEDNIFGVKVRKKDLVILDGLFKYILPDSDDLETYSAPSQSMSAPYFDALMRAYYNVTNRLNTVVKLHWNTLDDPASMMTDLDWIDCFKDLSVYDGAIPALSGNEGDQGTEDEDQGSHVSTPVSTAPGIFTAGAAAPKPEVCAAPQVETASTAAPKAPSPFRTENISAAIHQVSGPFAPGQPAAPLGGDPNAFPRPAAAESKGDKEDYAAWLARKSRAAPQPVAPVAQPMGYGAPQPAFGGFAQPVPPPNAPAWAVPQQAVAPGEYAGRVRGVPLTQYGYGGAQVPGWVNPIQAPPGYGFPQQQQYPQQGYPQQMGYPQQQQYPQQGYPQQGYQSGGL